MAFLVDFIYADDPACVGGEKRMAQAKSALNRLNMRISNSSKNMEMAKSRGQYDTLKRLATDIIHYSNEREAWNRYLGRCHCN